MERPLEQISPNKQTGPSAATPPYCPNPHCTCHQRASCQGQWWVRYGFARSKGQSENVQRYRCRSCQRVFSMRCFRLEYRQRGWAGLNARIFTLRWLGASIREVGRQIDHTESMVRGRLRRMAQYAYLRHTQLLDKNPNFEEDLAFDGLENFAGSQYDPNHIQQALGKESLFIYDFNFAPLNRKGRRSPRQRGIEAQIEAAHGRYPPKAIRTAAGVIFKRLHDKRPLSQEQRLSLVIYMDEHFQYRRALERDHPELQVTPIRISSKDTRNFQNHLFPVNHADLLIRQHSAAFRRETIAFSKTHAAMVDQYMLFSVAKNFIRPQFVKPHKHPLRDKAHKQTPAMAAGICSQRLSFREFFGYPLARAHVELNSDWAGFYDGRVPYPRQKKIDQQSLS